MSLLKPPDSETPRSDMFVLDEESGLWMPKPDGKQAIKLSSPRLSQEVDGELWTTISRIRRFLSRDLPAEDTDHDEEYEWLIFQDPRYASDVAIHRRFL